MRNIYLKSQSILHYLESYSESAVYITNNKWLNRSNFAYGVCAAAGELFDAVRALLRDVQRLRGLFLDQIL